MTLTIEIAPEKESRLRAKAAQRGVALDALLRDVVEGYADADDDAALCEARQREIIALVNATPLDWARALDEGTKVATTFYDTPAGREELADWRALQGEDFGGYEDETTVDSAQREAA
jgi:hypothetical protein